MSKLINELKQERQKLTSIFVEMQDGLLSKEEKIELLLQSKALLSN